jgi:hypothetical protein
MYTAYYDMLMLLQQEIQAVIRNNAPKVPLYKNRSIAIDEIILGSIKIKVRHSHSACIQFSSI